MLRTWTYVKAQRQDTNPRYSSYQTTRLANTQHYASIQTYQHKDNNSPDRSLFAAAEHRVYVLLSTNRRHKTSAAGLKSHSCRPTVKMFHMELTLPLFFSSKTRIRAILKMGCGKRTEVQFLIVSIFLLCEWVRDKNTAETNVSMNAAPSFKHHMTKSTLYMK
jgi:hypothetical protein